LASRFSGEFVVVRGSELIHHSTDLDAARSAYAAAFGDGKPQPSFVTPERRQRIPVTIRGRAVTPKLPR
jgi:hypothetical protein